MKKINYKKISDFFEQASKVCAVMIAPAIVLSTAATVILFPVTILSSLLGGKWKEKFCLIVKNPIVPIFLIFYSMFLVGIFYSTTTLGDAVLVVKKYSKFLLTPFLFPLFLEKRWRDRAIDAFLWGVFIMLVASFLREYGYLTYGATGVIEVFKQSIEFNFLMAFAAYLCLLKIISTDRYRLMLGVFLAFIVYTVLFRSIGRSGYFVFVGLMGLFFIQKFKWKGLLIGVVSSALLFSSAFYFSPTFKSRIGLVFSDVKTYQNNDNTSVGLRMTFIKNSLLLVKRNPFFGTGTGSFGKEYSKIDPSLVFTKNPHNEYAHIAVQFGIVGLLVLFLFFWVPIWYSRFLSDEQKYIARGAILAIMLGCLANSWLMDVAEGYFYVYFIALAFASLRHNPKKSSCRIS